MLIAGTLNIIYGIEICGRTLARAEAHSGDAVTITAYLGSSEVL